MVTRKKNSVKTIIDDHFNYEEQLKLFTTTLQSNLQTSKAYNSHE